jgi:hypothetical protein
MTKRGKCFWLNKNKECEERKVFARNKIVKKFKIVVFFYKIWG